uniref:Ribosomal protein S19 n=1 Tax=Diacronema viridis TaxID=2793420 RepID=A0A7T1W6B4_9EUKA|nr:ribosomal protein S19 [Diacronema viridis]QPO84595.1 ribosomal protein S19 [Diacronema viridis]QPO84615.1 ribosomal protein S19 [Diacronema viridis]
MSRSIKKVPFVSSHFLFQYLFESRSKVKPFFKSRSSTILPDFVGDTFQIYNGRSFFKAKISDAFVGKKFGELSHTRKSAVLKKARKLR